MNVVYVLIRPGPGPVYGGEKSTIITARGAADRGHSVRFLVTADDDITGELDAAGLPFEVVPVGDPVAGLRRAPVREGLRRLRQIVRLNRHVYRMAKGHRRSLVHVAGVPAVLGSWLGAKLAGASLVFHVRGTSRARRLRWYEGLAVLLADRTIATSDSLRGLLLATAPVMFRSYLSRRIVAVPNGFDFRSMEAFCSQNTRQECRTTLGLAPADVLGLLVASIGETKGQLRFLEEVLPATVARAPRLQVALIGGVNDERYMRRCQQAVAVTGLSNHVRFVGYQPQSDVYRWYRAADLGILTSASEGLPRAAVEAQAFGLPVVSTRVVGPVDVVEHDVTGYLIPEDHLGGMSECLARLALEATLRDRLGRAGAALMRERFALDRHHREIARIYSDLAR